MKICEWVITDGLALYVVISKVVHYLNRNF
jgi:hypothetical protein